MDYVIFPKRKELNMRLAVTLQKRKFLKRKVDPQSKKERAYSYLRFDRPFLTGYGPNPLFTF